MRPETKVRRVVLTLEVETDAPLSELRSVRCWNPQAGQGVGGGVFCNGRRCTVGQAQANVVRGPAAARARSSGTRRRR